MAIRFSKSGIKPYEGVISSIIILIVINFFLVKVIGLMDEVEKSGFERTLSIMRGELKLYTFEHMIRQQTVELVQYENSNPVNLVKNHPTNYLGEYLDTEIYNLPEGSWYFDKSSRQLVYRIKHGQVLKNKGAFVKEARYRVKFFFQDNDNNNRFDFGIDSSLGLGLEPQGDYHWD